jgi:hypothetical protein
MTPSSLVDRFVFRITRRDDLLSWVLLLSVIRVFVLLCWDSLLSVAYPLEGPPLGSCQRESSDGFSIPNKAETETETQTQTTQHTHRGRLNPINKWMDGLVYI